MAPSSPIERKVVNAPPIVKAAVPTGDEPFRTVEDITGELVGEELDELAGACPLKGAVGKGLELFDVTGTGPCEPKAPVENKLES